MRWTVKLVKYFSLLGVLGLAVACLYCWHLTAMVEKRFAGRRWNIPSVIYSDTLLLYPGAAFTRQAIIQRLEATGYSQKSSAPLSEGEFLVYKDALEVSLRPLAVPGKRRKGFVAILVFEEGRIASISHLQSGKGVSVLELEPEVLMRYFGREREIRDVVSLDELPDLLQHAVLSA